MPIYPYKCANCGHELETEQKIKGKPLKKCPVCGKRKLRRMIGKTSFMLLGGGWGSSGYK